MRIARAFAGLTVASIVVAACGASAMPPRDVDVGAGLEARVSLAATKYATGLRHVAAFAFDGDGRLWVATAAYEDEGVDAIYLVERAGETPQRIVTDVHTPLGLLWIGDTLYVASHARVDAYRGFGGTTFASSTNVVTFPSGVGENNGLALGPDGRIRLGISAPCDACTPGSEYSAAIVSFEPDGSGLRVEASGIRAPIGLAYYPGTSDLFVTMNQGDDLGDATPGDWLALVTAGDDWGFPSCYGQSSSSCRDVPDALAELDAHAAVSGIAIVTGELGTDIGDAAVVAEWATGKLVVVSLASTNNGYTARVASAITGLTNPVAVTLGPDHALYAGDWASGTVYRITAA